MRVLWLTNVPLPSVRARQGLAPLPGGGWLSGMLAALRREARDIELVCASRSWPAPESFVGDGVRYITLPRQPLDGRGRVLLSNWLSVDASEALESLVSRLIAEVQPDLIHVHGTESPHALAALRAAGATPVLVSVQGLVSQIVPCYYKGLAAADVVRDAMSLNFAKGRGLIHTWRRMKHAAGLEVNVLGTAAYVTGRTEWDRDAVLRANPRARYWHVEEVLREPFYCARWGGPLKGEPVVVAVTSAAPYKGTDVLLKAYARVLECRACRLVIVGQFRDTHLWPALRRLEAKLCLTGRIDWLGEQRAAEVAAIVSKCSVLVCASRIENSPNSVCEAMLVGAPVIATRAGGIPSLVTDGEDGLLFEVGDDAGLAKALLRVLNDEDLARGLGDRARAAASLRHDSSAAAECLSDVYHSILAMSNER